MSSNKNEGLARDCSARDTEERHALADPSGRSRPHFVGHRRQLAHSSARQHRHRHHSSRRPPSRTVVLLHNYVNRWSRPRRLSHLSHGAQRRQGNSREKVLAEKSKEGLRDFRTLGIRRRRHPCHPSAAISDYPYAFGCGSHAIPDEEVSDCSGRRPRHSVHHPGVSRLPLRTRHREVLCAVLLAGNDRPGHFFASRRTLRPIPVQAQTEGRTAQDPPHTSASPPPNCLASVDAPRLTLRVTSCPLWLIRSPTS